MGLAMEERYEIVVCGGGLAGSAAAIRLKQYGFSPIILEKKRFPRKKLCGEFLGPDSFTLLIELGTWPQICQKAYGPIHKAVFHTMSGESLAVKMDWVNPQQPYGLGISRESLDTIMIEHAKSLGVQVLEGYKVDRLIRGWGDEFQIRATNLFAHGGSQPRLFQTAIAIDATGYSGGRVLQADIPESDNQTKDYKIGISTTIHCPDPAQEKILEMFFFPEGYGGLLPLSDMVRNLCMLAPSGAAKLIHQPFPRLVARTIGQNPEAKRLLQYCEPLEPLQSMTFRIKKPLKQTGIIAVGDAFATVDPFTGSGMSVGIQTGVMAADAIMEGTTRGWSYARICQDYRSRYQRMLGMRFKLMNLFRPYLFSTRLQEMTSPFMRPLLPTLAGIFR